MNRSGWVEAEPVVAKPFDQVMICYPNPDVVCLEGGCIHCEDSDTWWTVEALNKYAYDKSQHHWTSFIYGRDHYWWNQRKKMGDTGTPFYGVGEDSEC